MRSMGIDDALRERGCSNGDIVRILGENLNSSNREGFLVDSKDYKSFI